MTDAVIRYGTQDWNLIRHVFLDGEHQKLVETINFTQGYIKRPYMGPLTNENQVKIDPGFVFDLIEDDFILETIYGNVSVVWYDHAVGRAWMAKHAN